MKRYNAMSTTQYEYYYKYRYHRYKSSNRPTKSPASRGRLPHFVAISRSPAATLKSPASLALNLVS